MNNNPTGKGGFGERPQDINREGAPKRGQNWQAVIKRITNMTREEAMEFVGKRSRLGRLLRELPPHLPLKDALVFISIIQYGRDPNPRMLSTLMDREEGKPVQPITGDPTAPLKVIVEYVDSQDTTPAPPPGAAEDQDGTKEVQRD